MSLLDKIIKSSLIRTINFILTAIISFFMMPFVIHSLGNRMYGLWVLIGSFLSYYGLLDLGISSAVRRFVSQALGKKNVYEVNMVVNTAVILFSLIGILVILISLIAAWIVPYFTNKVADINLFRKIILIMGVSTGISFPARVFNGVLSANLRYDISTGISMITLIIRTALIVIFLKQGYGVLALAIISASLNLIQYCSIFVAVRKLFPWLRFKMSLFYKQTVRKLFGYSVFSLISNIADYLRFRLDNFVIGAFLGLSPITVYAIPIGLLDYFTNFILSSVGFMAPLFSQYEGAGDMKSIRARFLDITKVCVLLAVFIGVSLLIYGKVFIIRWVGTKFESSYYILCILCIPSIIALMQNPSIGLLYGISKHKYYAVANNCEGILNLALSLILVKYYGLYGVALGTAIPMLLFKLLIQPVYVCRCINLSVKKYYKTVFFTAIKVIIVLLLYYCSIKSFLSPSYIKIFSIAILQTLIFIPIAFFLILDTEQRQFVKKELRIG
ncbi:MAG: hypothetical protein DRI61_17365 [Chloroflexi bacterium]|nr:MAG: hypothetical protein DRI61_17365 [Chloroflexota bacterium]